MIDSYSSDNYYQMALKIGLFEALKYALKIHAAAEEYDHSLNCSSSCSTTLDNKVIRELV